MTKQFREIIEDIPRIQQICRDFKEVLLANLVMLGEIPAPTFGEKERIRFLVDRFSECGLQNSAADEVGNGSGFLPGSSTARNIVVTAHADTVFSEKIDHTITVLPDRIKGPGVADNSIGLAALATLPSILEALEMHFTSNIILLANARSLGRGNLEGMKFFLKNSKYNIQAGLCVEGAQLGRLTLGSFGMMRGEVKCSVPEEYDWTRFGATGAIVTLNEVINRLVEIPLPRRPRTSIVLGKIYGGASYNTVATQAGLGFEIRSESEELLTDIRDKVIEIISEVTSISGASVELDIFAHRKVGGIPAAHPMAKRSHDIMNALQLQPRFAPSGSEISAFVDQGIPALTLGLTEAGNVREPDEFVRIEPLFAGLAQLIAVLAAVDGGYCDEH